MRQLTRLLAVALAGIVAVFGLLPPTPAEAVAVQTAAVSITGTPQVGATLTAVTDSAVWTPSDAKLTYQWYRGKSKIKRATKSTYAPTAADVGKQLKVKVTGSKRGQKSSSVYSAKTAKVAAGQVTTGSVTISGSFVVGSTLRVSTSGWAPSKLTLKYQWYRGNSKIKGAVKSHYKLTRADQPATITVAVTASKSGYRSVTVRGALADAGFADGTYTVPGQVKPGKYVANVTPGVLCEWQRRSDLGWADAGTLGEGASAGGQVIVAIASGDRYFRSSGCGTWKPLPTTGSPASSFVEGQYEVGLHLVPGTYRTDDVAGDCFWVITSGFGGTEDEVIVWDEPETLPEEITLALGQGVQTIGCGTWRRLS